MERLADAATRAFARHETFHPRYGWFRKAVEAAQRNSDGEDLFLADDATVELGVGKNMVRAIRFWGRAAKLITDSPNPNRPRTPFTVPSRNGFALFDFKRGLDPYMELPGTQWLLHWWMLQPITELPIWWLTFNRFTAVEFSEEDLVSFTLDEIDRAGWDRPNVSSVRKDVACLLRMYSASDAGRASLDDLLDCPMRELALIEPAWGERHKYRFLLGAKPTLPDLVLLFACLEWMRQQSSSSLTVSVNRLATAVGSPGRVFRLSENDLAAVLGGAVSAFPDLRLSAAAGAPTLSCLIDPEQAAVNVLAGYYRQNGRTVASTLRLGEEAFDGSSVTSVGRNGPSAKEPDVIKALLNFDKLARKRAASL